MPKNRYLGIDDSSLRIPPEDRATSARGIAGIVSAELLADLNIVQECHYEPSSDRLAFPATEDRPYITVALPLAIIPSPFALRELVSNILSSYTSRLPR